MIHGDPLAVAWAVVALILCGVTWVLSEDLPPGPWRGLARFVGTWTVAAGVVVLGMHAPLLLCVQVGVGGLVLTEAADKAIREHLQRHGSLRPSLAVCQILVVKIASTSAIVLGVAALLALAGLI